MRKWQYALAAFACGAALLAAGCGGEKTASSAAKGKVTIGIMQTVEHGSLDAARQGFRAGLEKRGYGADRCALVEKNAQGDPSNLSIIASQFHQEKPALILAIGTPAAQAAANEIKEIPIVGTAITDYTRAKLVESDDKPGGNVTGVSDLISIDAQMDLGRALVPDAKTVGLLYSSSEVNSEVQANLVKDYARKHGLAVEERTIVNVNDLQQVAESLVGKVDFLYVPTDNTVAAAVPTLLKVTDPAKIPVIVGAVNMAKDGALAALSVDYYRLGQQTADLAVDILEGKAKPETAPIQHQKDYTIVINKEDVSILGMTIPKEIAEKADMV